MALWATQAPIDTTEEELKLQLQPDGPVIIGRQQGGRIDYLDPNYTPTPMLPDASRSILKMHGHGGDTSVSRGHFMLRANANGVLLVNGVPPRGGGIRPLLNGTTLLAPECRNLCPGEEYLIENGSSAKIRLPNGTVVLLTAN